jgi:quercetin dioxygenase-like cupin family protein
MERSQRRCENKEKQMRNRRRVAVIALVGAAILVFQMRSQTSGQEHKRTEGIELFPPEMTKWQAGPPSLPKGASIAVLEGNPAKEGPFVFRLKLPDGYRVPPHTHPKTERVTVISGTFHIGMGKKFDQGATKPMPAGTYGYWEAGMAHFVWTKGETILQFHGQGPWSIQYVNPGEDPRTIKER